MPPSILSIGSPTSDGLQTNRPATDSGLTQCDGYFRIKIAQKWAKDRKDVANKNRVILDRLPDGFAGFERARPNDPKHIDRYIYGHSNGRFDSIEKFYVHFKHMVDHGGVQGCACVHCPAPDATTANETNVDASKTYSDEKPLGKWLSAGVKRKSAISVDIDLGPIETIRPKRRVTTEDNQQNDAQLPEHKTEEQACDVHSSARVEAQLQKDDTEEQARDKPGQASIATQRPMLSFTDLWKPLVQKDQPRVSLKELSKPFADLVRNISIRSPDSLVYHVAEDTVWPLHDTTIYDFVDKWLNTPPEIARPGEVVLYYTGHKYAPKPTSIWQAGVVVQYRLQSSSAVIQCLINKDVHELVDINHIRPFQFWKVCMPCTDLLGLPLSICEALYITNTMSVLSPYRLGVSVNNDEEPDGQIYCRGFYNGHELLLVGDMVKLRPESSDSNTIVDIMIITRIKLKTVHCSQNSPPHVSLHVTGRVYTSDPARSYGGYAHHPVSIDELKSKDDTQWYHVLDPDNPKSRLETPHHRILGRCYGSAEKFWLEAEGITSDDKDAADEWVLCGDSFASEYSTNKLKDQWLWSKTRLEQLRLEGISTGRLPRPSPML